MIFFEVATSEKITFEKVHFVGVATSKSSLFKTDVFEVATSKNITFQNVYFFEVATSKYNF